MQFDDQRVDTSGVEDQRGGGGGGGMFPGGGGGGGGMGGMGGMGTMIAAGGLSKLLGGGLMGTIVIMLLFSCLNNGGGSSAPSNAIAPPAGAQGISTDLSVRCNQAGAIDQYADCLLVKGYNETNEVWTKEFARLGQPFRAPKLVFFEGKTNTACGPANTNVGPFYCPGDEKIYFDLGFSRQLQKMGVQGQYANIYIMGHEYGHHLQKILGIEKQVRQLQARDRRNANAYSVRMELQADCLAGVWGRLANDQGNVAITQKELGDAVNAAAAVGDDKIMRDAGMRVNESKFTHGSSQQRQEWYMTGFNSADMNKCNTFAS